ncbi:MAG: hypothetical protein H6736_21900 [Alphaproteobacteria bacterium]|nr:hypothetical protein [Alphaproteobacteria bacterium]MCB9694472.1 hypothetical protein [Alphaproteobacteria bacterium]
MLHFLAIFVDDELKSPIYADPEPQELEPDLWAKVADLVVDAQDGELRAEGAERHGDMLIGWRAMVRNGLTFVCVVEDVEEADVKVYLKELAGRYFDEVDDVRHPERDGVADVVVDVIPPWD